MQNEEMGAEDKNFWAGNLLTFFSFEQKFRTTAKDQSLQVLHYQYLYQKQTSLLTWVKVVGLFSYRNVSQNVMQRSHYLKIARWVFVREQQTSDTERW